MSHSDELFKLIGKDIALSSFTVDRGVSKSSPYVSIPESVDIVLSRGIMQNFSSREGWHESEYWIMKAFIKLHDNHYANYYPVSEREVKLEIEEHNILYFVNYLKHEISMEVFQGLGT